MWVMGIFLQLYTTICDFDAHSKLNLMKIIIVNLIEDLQRNGYGVKKKHDRVLTLTRRPVKSQG